MKRISKRNTNLLLILFIVLVGVIISGIKVISLNNESKSVNSEIYDVNTKSDKNTSEEIANEEKNKEDEIIKEDEVEFEDKVDYLTLNPEDVEIPILMYHSISDSDPNNTLLVPINQFDEEVKWLKEEGFTPMLLDDVLESFSTGKVPKKAVAITFDDGYSDNYTEAYKILQKYNMKATFFIITDNIDSDSWYMNSNMLKEMSSNGMGIENHTSRHIEFTNISREDKINIIKDGINKLQEKVGVKSKFLCYPVGKYDDETIEVAEELGVQAAVTTESGFSDISDGLYSLNRIRISPMEIKSFKSIFSDF